MHHYQNITFEEQNEFLKNRTQHYLLSKTFYRAEMFCNLWTVDFFSEISNCDCLKIHDVENFSF